LGDSESPHLKRWVNELESRKCIVKVLTLNEKYDASSATYIGHEHLPLGLPLSLFNLKKEIKSFSPDIVHAHYVSSYGFLASLANFNPLILSAWGSDILVTAKRSWLARKIIGFVLSRATHVFADSTELLQESRALARLKNAHLILWGIDLNKIPPKETIPENPFVITSARLLEPIYQIDQIILGFMKALETDPNLQLNIMGRGTVSGALQKLAAPAAQKIKFMGFIPEVDAMKTLAKSHCAISVPKTDGTAMSVLEAMACGLPIICSDLSANREWIPCEGNIFLKEINSQTIANAILEMKTLITQNSVALTHKQIINARANRENEFNRVLDIYERSRNS
jgi:glycosyltransferase involved in cell wall biosynthesis